MKTFDDEHIHIFHIRVKFHDEITFMLLCEKKKTNPVIKMIFKNIFSYRPEPKKNHHEIYLVCRKLIYVHHYFFLIFKNILLFFTFNIWVGACEIGLQNKFCAYQLSSSLDSSTPLADSVQSFSSKRKEL